MSFSGAAKYDCRIDSSHLWGTSLADAEPYRAPYEDILSARSGKPIALAQAVSDEKRVEQGVKMILPGVLRAMK